jgi:hypothetical protein
MDLDEFSNYLILRAFIGYQIADLNNRYWRNRDGQGKWRWIAADLEHGFGQLGGDLVSENTIAKLAGLSGDLPEWATLLFNRLLQNSEFRDGFIQRSAAYLNTIFQPSVTTRHRRQPEKPVANPDAQAYRTLAIPAIRGHLAGQYVNFIKTFLKTDHPLSPTFDRAFWKTRQCARVHANRRAGQGAAERRGFFGRHGRPFFQKCPNPVASCARPGLSICSVARLG